MNQAPNMKFVGTPYSKQHNGENPPLCMLYDEVVIHPVSGVSQATQSYPGIILSTIASEGSRYEDVSGPFIVLVCKGRGSNSDWKGAWVNDYLFQRLEFIRRGE